jgi:hypothetical protein
MHIISGLFSVMLILSVYAIEKNRQILRISIILAALVVLTHWASSLHIFGLQTPLADLIITTAFFALTTVVVMNGIIRSPEITASTIFGAICGYLLMGLTWSFLHSLIYAINPQAYIIPHGASDVQQVQTLNFIYYSFVTQATVGYGDIVAVSHVARTFSWIEAISGQIYLTVWIARLIALHIKDK